MGYWARFWQRLAKDFAKATGEQVIGALLTVGILYFQIRYGLIHSGEIRGSYWAVAWPYLLLVGALFLWHFFRTAYVLHLDTVTRVANETEARLKEKSLKPEFRTKIDCAIWDHTNGDRLYVHVQIVNASEASSTIRRIALRSPSTGEAFNALPFTKASLMRRGQSRLDVSINEGEFTSYKTSKILDPFSDSLERLTSSTFVRGEGKKGWLMFPLRHSFESGTSLTLTLSIEDAFGDLHESEPSSVPVDFGSVFP